MKSDEKLNLVIYLIKSKPANLPSHLSALKVPWFTTMSDLVNSDWFFNYKDALLLRHDVFRYATQDTFLKIHDKIPTYFRITENVILENPHLCPRIISLIGKLKHSNIIKYLPKKINTQLLHHIVKKFCPNPQSLLTGEILPRKLLSVVLECMQPAKIEMKSEYYHILAHTHGICKFNQQQKLWRLKYRWFQENQNWRLQYTKYWPQVVQHGVWILLLLRGRFGPNVINNVVIDRVVSFLT